MHTPRFLLPALGKRWRFGQIIKQTVLWEAVWTFAVAPFVIGSCTSALVNLNPSDEWNAVACLMVAFVIPTEIVVDRPFVTMKVVYVLNAALRKFWSTYAWFPNVDIVLAVSLKLRPSILYLGRCYVYHRARRTNMAS